MKRTDNDSSTASNQFTEGNPSTGTPATILSAQFLNVLQEEIASFVEMSGQLLDQTGADTSQIKKAVAVAVAGMDFYNAAGTSNAITLAPTTGNLAPASYFNGMRVRFTPTADNTSSSTTVKVGGLAAITVRVGAGSGTSAPAGTFVAGVNAELVYDAASSTFKAPTPAEADARPSVQGTNITLSNASADAEHDIVFGAGFFEFEDGTGFSTAISETKRIDATWVSGTGQGGLDTGAVAPNSLYDCYVISNSGGTTTDGLFVLAGNAPVIPSGYNTLKKCYVGKIATDANSNIIPFTKKGDETFLFGGYEIRDASENLVGGETFPSGFPVNSFPILYISSAADNATNPAAPQRISILAEELGVTESDLDSNNNSPLVTVWIASSSTQVTRHPLPLGASSDIRAVCDFGSTIIYQVSITGWKDTQLQFNYGG